MQPRPDRTIASRSPDVRGRRSASAPGPRHEPTPLDRSALLTDLSATVSHILGLQQFHVGDVESASRLRRAVAELELLITRLLHTGGVGAAPTLPPWSSVHTPRQRAAEQAFLVWLAEPTDADEVPLSADGEAVPLARLLGELSLSRRRLPTEAAASIGLPGGTTVGHAAAELLLAVKDPAGPRCPSFRAAGHYLRERELERGRFPSSPMTGRSADG